MAGIGADGWEDVVYSEKRDRYFALQQSKVEKLGEAKVQVCAKSKYDAVSGGFKYGWRRLRAKQWNWCTWAELHELFADRPDVLAMMEVVR